MRAPDERTVRRVRAALLRWYALRGRRFPWRKPRASRYLLVLSEVLLQRTRAEAVGQYIAAFRQRHSSWTAIAGMSLRQIAKELMPLGLWRQRAVRLSSLAKAIRANGGRFPSFRTNIESLPGVGQYVANAIELFVFGRPRPLLDSGMARLLERAFGRREKADIRYDDGLQTVAQRIVASKHARDLNWAILDLAATVCRPRLPLCERCPLGSLCDFNRRKR